MKIALLLGMAATVQVVSSSRHVLPVNGSRLGIPVNGKLGQVRETSDNIDASQALGSKIPITRPLARTSWWKPM